MTAERLLLAAFRGWGDAPRAERAFGELVDRLRGESALPPWYMEPLDGLAGVRRDSFHIPNAMGRLEAGCGRSVDDGARALQWLSIAAQNLELIKDPAERARLKAWNRKYAVDARLLRALHGDATLRSTEIVAARSELQTLIEEQRLADKLTDSNWPGVESYLALMRACSMADDVVGESTALKEALAVFPDDTEIVSAQADLEMHAGDFNGATQTVLQLLELPNVSRQDRSTYQIELAILELVSGNSDAEQAARDARATNDPYRDYVMLMLYWRLSLDNNPRARTLLDERWKEIDSTSWQRRLEAGDETVWREMLIAYYVGHRKEEEITGPFQDRQTFERSPYSRIGIQGLTFGGMTCEAYFYSALLEDVTGDSQTREDRMHQKLQKCKEVGEPTTYEYQMARYLLSHASAPL